MVVPKAGQRPFAAHISEPATSTSLDPPPPPPSWGTLNALCGFISTHKAVLFLLLLLTYIMSVELKG